MNAQQYSQWLNNPYDLTTEHNTALKEIVDKYPYLQSARALYLKTLHQQRSLLYNNELKKTAAYTTDRDVLFEYIISEDFITYQSTSLNDIKVVDEGYISSKPTEPTLDETIEKRVLDTLAYIENQDKETQLIQKIEHISQAKSASNSAKNNEQNKKEIVENVTESLEETLEVGNPLEFSENDRFSFNEWLTLTKTQTIERPDNIPSADKQEQLSENFEKNSISTKEKKMEIIDKFIQTNPKITPNKSFATPSLNLEKMDENEPYYMTETLARIYLEQKKYQKAIQAYEILILKYPEKSSLFANRITDIKKLQEFNNI